MSGRWRLIDFESNDAPTNMAIDEAILICRSKGESPNTLRLYSWQPSAVSIGFFQSLQDEVDIEACRREGVDIVRRITGGGAVYHDSRGEVTYSLIVGEGEHNIPKDILNSYRLICSGIIKGLELLGVKATFQPVNDILVNGRKISGNAQTRRMGVILQHGTVLVDADLKRMFRLLKVSDEKIRDKMIKSAEERVTTLRRELSSKPSLQEVASTLKTGFEQALNLNLTCGRLTEEEFRLATKLKSEKYSSWEWIFRR
ncbi:MAG: biotin/lipoate A/B protein ligase family protein [Candidatus Bathyarchaeia archaeon]